ncbi:MAG: hypothetical protein JXN65_07280 [Clostridia bacterium]|nr:hypothetical protein [Clostridia bacterium]
MKARKIIAYIVITLYALFLLAGCNESAEVTEAPTPSPTASPSLEETLEGKISEVINTKMHALETKDIDSYLSTVTQNDAYYYNEQSRWYSEMIQSVISEIHLEVVSVKSIDESTLEAVIHQTHTGNGEHFDFTYPLLFKLDKGEWMDYGYNFESIVTPRYTLKYMSGETRINEFKEMIDTAYDNLEAVFAEKADDNFEIKLFWDREMLRQRTIPSAAFLFTGWGEPNESLKLYTGHPDIESYHGTIQHELVHHITIKICNNNLADWLLEGTAVYYGNAYYDYSLTNSLANLKKENIAQTIDDLNNTDLYHAESQQQVWDWYNTGFGYVAYIVETYGVDKFIELYNEAGKKPFNDSVANESFKADNIQTTSEVLSAVLGITPEQLSEDYLNWLEITDFFDFS